MRRSQAEAITAPAPATVPLSAAITGRRQRRMARIRSQVMRVNSSRPRESRPNSAPMMSSTSPPEQNAAAGAGEHDRAHVGLGVERAKRVAQLGVDLERERVQPLRAVERERRHTGVGVQLVQERTRRDRHRPPSPITAVASISTRAPSSTQRLHLDQRHGRVIAAEARAPGLAQIAPARAVGREIGHVHGEARDVAASPPAARTTASTGRARARTAPRIVRRAGAPNDPSRPARRRTARGRRPAPACRGSNRAARRATAGSRSRTSSRALPGLEHDRLAVDVAAASFRHSATTSAATSSGASSRSCPVVASTAASASLARPARCARRRSRCVRAVIGVST